MREHIIQYWLDYAFGLLVLAFTALCRWLKKRFRAQDDLKTACLALLHNDLYQACRHHIVNGSIDVDDLENVESLYSAYHALGGNGTGTALIKKCRSLPLKGED